MGSVDRGAGWGAGWGQVEASVWDRGGEHEGEGRSGEEGGEAGDPSPAAQGDPGSSNGAVRRAREEGEAQGWRGRGKKARVEERVGYDGCGMAEGDHLEQGGMGGSGGSGSTRERGEMGGSGGSSGEPGVNGEGGEVGGEVEWMVTGYGFRGGGQRYVTEGSGKRRRLASDEMRERYGERLDP